MASSAGTGSSARRRASGFRTSSTTTIPSISRSSPEEGYHLTEDITDKAIEFIRDAKAVAPEKPFFLYYAPGACHAPHHAPKEWIDRYKGRFDMGYEAMREQTLARQKETRHRPGRHRASRRSTRSARTETRTGPDGKPFPPLDETLPWDSLAADEKRLFSRMAEVYAGFLSHADHHIGRLLDFLEFIGERDNTLVILVSDNGASGEGGPNGSVNEMRFINGIPDDMAANLAMLDDLGGPKTYNHYPNGWAMAFNTPFKMWKRYEFNGGTSDPCIVSWPAGMKSRGELRTQYHHAIDLVPTVLDVLGVEAAGHHQGPRAEPVRRREHALQLRRRSRLRRRGRTQFYSMLGSRGIWHDGWKAVTNHPTIAGWSHFNDDEWELYHTDVDRSEVHNLAAEHPEKVRELVGLWFAEAGANGAFPLDDRSPSRSSSPAAACSPHRRTATSTSPTAPRSRRRRPSTSATGRSRSVRSSTSQARRRGRVVRSRVTLRWAQPLRQGQPAPLRQQLRRHVRAEDRRRPRIFPTGQNLILVRHPSRRPATTAQRRDRRLSLWHGDVKVGEAQIKTQPGMFMLAGEGLCVGRDSGAEVTDDYPGTSRGASPAARSTGSRSTSAASPTSTSSARRER